jgi:lipopolysaccharide export system protein LptA
MEDDAGVRVSRGAYAMQGKRMVLVRRDSRADCLGDARVVFVPEGAGGERPAKATAPVQPWVIQGETLAVRFSADMKGLDEVDTTGHVTIATEGGPAAAGAGGETRFSAAGDRFIWAAPARRGVLTGSPVVLGQGGHRMEAARVVFFPLDQRVVLQGPKRIEFAGSTPSPAAGAAPAGGSPVAARDGVIDIGDGAIVLTPQTLLETDRLQLKLAPDGGGIQRALGWGHVRLSDRVSGTGVFGDHLEWDVKSQEFLVEGVPFAYILQKGSRLQGQAITITRQPDGLRCANRSGLRGRIQIGTPAEDPAKPAKPAKPGKS